MRRSALLVATVMLAAGCHVSPATLAPAPQGGPRAAPLFARLITDFRGVPAFLLDEPAWVSVFDVTPGQPVAQVFPMSGFDRVYPQMQGLTPARYGYSGGHRIAFPVGLASSWGYWSTFGPFTSLRVGGQPRHLLLVAARRPLRLPARTFSASWLRDVSGVRYTLAGGQQEAVAQRLLDAVVPPDLDADRDIATDYLVVWDQPERPLASDVVYLRCANGQFVAVPLWWYLGAAQAALPLRADCRAEMQRPGGAQDSTGHDSTGMRPPRPPASGTPSLIRATLTAAGGASDEITSRWGHVDTEATRRVEDLTIDPYSRARHTGIREAGEVRERTLIWSRRDESALERAGGAGGVATGGGWSGGGADRRIEPRTDRPTDATAGPGGAAPRPTKSEGGANSGELPTVRPPHR